MKQISFAPKQVDSVDELVEFISYAGDERYMGSLRMFIWLFIQNGWENRIGMIKVLRSLPRYNGKENITPSLKFCKDITEYLYENYRSAYLRNIDL